MRRARTLRRERFSRPGGFREEVLDVQRPVAVRHRVRVLGDEQRVRGGFAIHLGLAVLDDQIGTSLSNWPAVRLAGFIILNAILGAAIYVLFSKAGIIGPGNGPEAPEGKVMDAELA